MKKYCKFLMIFVALSSTPLECGVGAGFSKIWEGTKDIAKGTWDAVRSPFRSKKDKNGKKLKNKKEEESCSRCKAKCLSCESRRNAKKKKRKNKK